MARTICRDRVQPASNTCCMIKAKTRTGALTYGNYTGPHKYIPDSTNSTALVALNKLGQARSGTTHRVQNLIVSDSFDTRLSVRDRSCQPPSSPHVHHILHAFDTIRKSTSRKAPSSKTTAFTMAEAQPDARTLRRLARGGDDEDDVAPEPEREDRDPLSSDDDDGIANESDVVPSGSDATVVS